MADPSSAWESVGVSVSSLLAGFAGAVASLSFVPGLSRWQAVATVLTGMAASTYLSPLAAAGLSHYVTMTPAAERGIGFALGLLAMSLLGGFIKAGKRFAEDPLGFWRRGEGR